MKNFEKHIDEIMEESIMGFAVVNGEIKKCSETSCNECELYHEDFRCRPMRKKWLLKEVKNDS